MVRAGAPHAVHVTLRFSAEVFPLFATSSYWTCWPSLRVDRPALSRRDMDENVLAAALRLNEPITFHDTGRHRTLSPFGNFDDTGAPHRIQDVARQARPYGLLAITKKFDQSELDHRPALASYSPARIRATAAMQRFGSYGPVRRLA